jgi:hypothetical protein
LRASVSFIRSLRNALSSSTNERIDSAIRSVVQAKQRGAKVVVVTGSGPNVHEGVTTLIAAMIHKGWIDGVITSSAVVAHEMAGTLDRVKRIVMGPHDALPIPAALLPRGGVFELTLLSPDEGARIETEMPAGWELYDRLLPREGNIVIKAAGNMAWPMGLRTERLAREVRDTAIQFGLTFERLAGFGADPMTMIGAGAMRNVPVLVSIPQLVGGGAVGIGIGDSIAISRRSREVAAVVASADVIIESAIALSQEIHDGPFETYTGHGIWAAWDDLPTYTLRDKTLVRIDLDSNLERAWDAERHGSEVQNAVNQGLPKTKRTGIPFRMEMSGFARLEGSIPITADIGVVWPILACACEEQLGGQLDFLSAPQESDEGMRMREWITDHVAFVDRPAMFKAVKDQA